MIFKISLNMYMIFLKDHIKAIGQGVRYFIFDLMKMAGRNVAGSAIKCRVFIMERVSHVLAIIPRSNYKLIPILNIHLFSHNSGKHNRLFSVFESN